MPDDYSRLEDIRLEGAINNSNNIRISHSSASAIKEKKVGELPPIDYSLDLTKKLK